MMRVLEYIGVITGAMAVATTVYASTNLHPQMDNHPIPPTINMQEVECMAQNIYFEANNQSKAGMIAVARVVVNRMRDNRYPDTACEVILEGPIRESWKTRKDESLADKDRVFYPVRNRCQFSWYCDGKADIVPSPKTNLSWRLAQDIAVEVLAFDKYTGIVEGATHYHADYVKPTWRSSLTLVTKIDDHIFYRWD